MRHFCSLLITILFLYLSASGQCDPALVTHYNMGDFPFTSSTGVTVSMSGTNSGTLGPYNPYGCSPATLEANTIRLDPGDDLILTFSVPVFEVTFVAGVMNTGESGTVVTNGSNTILSSNCPSDLQITGSNINQIGALASPVITVTDSLGFTQLTISCSSGVWTVDMLDCIRNTSFIACDPMTTPHYNMGDFPFTSSTGVTVSMGGTNSGTLGPYTAYGCSPAECEANTIRLDSGDDLILTFSEAVYEFTFIAGVMNTSESGSITTNGGTPYISSSCPSDFQITGNAFEQVGPLSSPVVTVRDSSVSGFTQLTIACSNGVWTVDVLDCVGVTTFCPATFAILTESACDSFVSPSGNYTWTNTNIYLDTIPNSSGCDSVITVDLTINSSYSFTDTETACDTFVWDVNGMSYTSTGTYSESFNSVEGCDSIHNLILTINNSSSSILNVTGIDSTTVNGQTFTQSGSYTQTLTNAVGCDSVITVNVDLTFTSILMIDDTKLFVYPNPTTNLLMIEGLSSLTGKVWIQLRSMNGNLVYQEALETDRLDLSEIPAGIYYLSIEHEGRSQTIKIVKSD